MVIGNMCIFLFIWLFYFCQHQSRNSVLPVTKMTTLDLIYQKNIKVLLIGGQFGLLIFCFENESNTGHYSCEVICHRDNRSVKGPHDLVSSRHFFVYDILKS
ncbi:hypothetical protein ACF0H5_003829 [Mactra antiquata]